MTDATGPMARSGPGSTGSVLLELGSRSVERPADAGSTMVAGLEGRAPAMVDGGGLVTPWLADWSIDWWIGADDRWHLPAREPAVRQRRLGHGPIIETSLRVPSGDVVQTVYPVVVAGGPATVIEIRNDSPVPVALALAVRPYPVQRSRTGDRQPSGPAGHYQDVSLDLSLDLDAGPAAVMVDSVPAIILPRRPNEAGACSDRDLLDEVRNGRALSWEGQVRGPLANAVCLYPLPHKTSLRFAVPGPRVGSFGVDDLPDPDAAARGWTAVVDRPSRFQFPDSGISDLAGAARARLLLAANDLPRMVVDGDAAAGPILAGLATAGYRLECRRAVEGFSRSFPTEVTSATAGGDLARAIGLAVELLGDPELCEAVLEALAQLTHLTERAAGGADPVATSDARRALARVAELAGQQQAADSLRVGLIAAPVADLALVSALSEQAAPARRWDDPDGVDRARPAARFWLAARELLLRDAGPVSGEPVIELLPDFPTAWRGGTVEVHRAPVAGALISFAIRWHGYRPALLWEVDGIEPNDAPGGDSGSDAVGGSRGDGPPFGPVRLICPGLDPAWETTERTGEALLAGSADELPAAPAPGDSFG